MENKKKEGRPRKTNKIEVIGPYTKIFLNGNNPDGIYTVIDTEDYFKVEDYSWTATTWKHLTYVKTNFRLFNSYRVTKKLHQLILPVSEGKEVDHKNGNGLDNRKDNLREATPTQNSQNSKKQNNKSHSQYKGVFWAKDRNKWRAGISFNEKYTILGTFTDEIEAAKAYDKKAKELHGEFARLNFPKYII